MPAQVNAVDAAGADYGKAIQSKKKKPTFECPHCSRKFATRSHLVRHSRVHTGERRYACDYPGCEMRCSRKDNLQQHYRTHLVVNPRRANAQSMLSAGAASGTTATAGGSHEAANDPEAQDVSIHRHNNNNNNNNGAGEYTSDPTRLMGSPTDLKPIPSDPSQPPLDNHHNHNHNHGLGAHLQTASHLDVAHHHDPTSAGANPDRDWSLSPPPPLSSAYDYWYAHGCLPHTVRNPASVSGSGSSGATSPELSNALELAPGQGGQQQQHAHHSHSHPHSHHHHPAPPHHPHHAPPPHHHSHMHPTHHHHHPQQPGPPQHHLPPVHTAHHPHPHPHQQQQQQQQRHSYVESPTGYYHSHHNMPNTAGGYSSYDGGEGGAATMRTSFSLGTATFPSPADYHHPAAPPPPTTAAHHGHPHHSHHQRSNSYSRMGGGGGYESATTSPHISNAHLHHAPHSGLPAPPTRHHSYPNGTDSYAVAAAAAAASYHNSPTEYKFHPPPPQQQHVYPGPSSVSVSGNESRPVTRHGSMTATATTSGYTTVPVYPSHPHATAQTTMGYGVAAAAAPLDMTGSSGASSSSHGPQATNASAEQQQQSTTTASGANSPRGSSLPPPPLGSSLATASQSGSGSLVLPPIRYSDGMETTNTNGETTPTASTSSVSASASASAYGMMGLGGPSGHGHGHFTSATPQNGWERVSISDARALPPHPSAMTR